MWGFLGVNPRANRNKNKAGKKGFSLSPSQRDWGCSLLGSNSLLHLLTCRRRMLFTVWVKQILSCQLMTWMLVKGAWQNVAMNVKEGMNGSVSCRDSPPFPCHRHRYYLSWRHNSIIADDGKVSLDWLHKVIFLLLSTSSEPVSLSGCYTDCG